MDIDSLAGKVVVVTGATSGIGRATAALASKAGATLIALGRHLESLKELELELPGDHHLGISCDVKDPISVRDAFGLIGNRYSKIDALLNVAGGMQLKRLDACADEDIAHIVGLNFLGPIYTTRAAIPLLSAAGGGDILNVSSEVTLYHMPFGVMYTSTKVALESFSTFMSRELRPQGIRVSLLRFGRTDTPMPTTVGEEDRALALPAHQQSGLYDNLGAAMNPDIVANTILYVITRPREQIIDVYQVRSFSD